VIHQRTLQGAVWRLKKVNVAVDASAFEAKNQVSDDDFGAPERQAVDYLSDFHCANREVTPSQSCSDSHKSHAEVARVKFCLAGIRNILLGGPKNLALYNLLWVGYRLHQNI
jgi:hypothetical protein